MLLRWQIGERLQPRAERVEDGSLSRRRRRRTTTTSSTSSFRMLSSTPAVGSQQPGDDLNGGGVPGSLSHVTMRPTRSSTPWSLHRRCEGIEPRRDVAGRRPGSPSAAGVAHAVARRSACPDPLVSARTRMRPKLAWADAQRPPRGSRLHRTLRMAWWPRVFPLVVVFVLSHPAEAGGKARRRGPSPWQRSSCYARARLAVFCTTTSPPVTFGGFGMAFSSSRRASRWRRHGSTLRPAPRCRRADGAHDAVAGLDEVVAAEPLHLAEAGYQLLVDLLDELVGAALVDAFVASDGGMHMVLLALASLQCGEPGWVL